jgi:serine/threonine protein kinase
MNNFNNNKNGFPMLNTTNLNNVQMWNYLNNKNNFFNDNNNNNSNNIFNNNINSQFNSINSQDNENEIIDDKYILNILKKNAQYKLSDFGLSKLKTEINEKNLCGSPLYMAPELLSKGCNIIKIEDPKVDIWALGVMAYEMFFGKRPFQALSIDKLINIYKVGEYHIDLTDIKGQKISKELVEFIILCLKGDPKKRANVEDLRNSSFYNMSYKAFEKMEINELKEFFGDKNEADNKLVLSIYKEYTKIFN